MAQSIGTIHMQLIIYLRDVILGKILIILLENSQLNNCLFNYHYRNCQKEEGIVFQMTLVTMQSVVLIIHSPFKLSEFSTATLAKLGSAVSMFSVFWRA